MHSTAWIDVRTVITFCRSPVPRELLAALTLAAWSHPGLHAASNSAATVEIRDGGIVRGPATMKKLALVFTGHEFGEGAPGILDDLTTRGVMASFFLTGAFLTNAQFADAVTRVVNDGHYLGPHSDAHLLYCSWDPARSTLLSRATFAEDLLRNQAKIARLLSPAAADRTPRYFLPAYEHYNPQIAAWSAAAGFTLINFTPGTRSNADYTQDGAPNFCCCRSIRPCFCSFSRITGNTDGGTDR